MSELWGVLWIKIFIIAVPIILIIVFFGWIFSHCKSKPPITPEQVQKINSRNAAERISALNEVVEQNADTIKTVDGRNTLANVEIEKRSDEAAARVLDANAKVVQAKAGDGRDVSEQEILDLIEGK